jgi:hypothetical protein
MLSFPKHAGQWVSEPGIVESMIDCALMIYLTQRVSGCVMIYGKDNGNSALLFPLSETEKAVETAPISIAG